MAEEYFLSHKVINVMKQETFYCLVLAQSQMRFLAQSKYGIDRMKALVSLIELASTSEQMCHKKGFSTLVHVGQVVKSEVELSHLWKCDRKTVSKVLDRMNQVGLVATVQTNRTSIHTLLCVSAWFMDGKRIINPYYVPMDKRHNSENRHVNSSNILAIGDAAMPSSASLSDGNVHIPKVAPKVALGLMEIICSLEAKKRHENKDCCHITSNSVAAQKRREELLRCTN